MVSGQKRKKRADGLAPRAYTEGVTEKGMRGEYDFYYRGKESEGAGGARGRGAGGGVGAGGMVAGDGEAEAVDVVDEASDEAMNAELSEMAREVLPAWD